MCNLGETILVVEDDPQIRNFIGFTLRSEGYAHETAANGKSAMQAMVSKPIDLMLALDMGADDYLTKPFSSTELLARIRVALRHMYKQGGGKTQTLFQIGELQLDAEKRRVFLRGEELHVTPMEYSLLSLLFRNQGKVLTTAVIIREIWGPGYGNDTQALRALMAGLRRKLEKNPAKPRYILTEIGVGYRLADE